MVSALAVAVARVDAASQVNAQANGAASGVKASTTTSADTAAIARGAYLAKAADCAGCHTAAPSVPRPGIASVPPPAFAGGLGMASPFGTIYSSNITPDPHAGIGRYSYDDFARALRDGVAPGGKRLYPA
ncbi:MAG TPA: cytochrome c, partial [Paraburkholderia sp.]